MILWGALLLGGCATVDLPPEPRVTRVAGGGPVLAEPAPLAPEGQSPVRLAEPTAREAAPPTPAVISLPVPPSPTPVTPPLPALVAVVPPAAATPAPAPGPPREMTPAIPPAQPMVPAGTNPAAAPVPLEHWVALEPWAAAPGRAVIQRQGIGNPPAYLLAGTNGTLALEAGRLAARWNGVEFRLGFAPQMRGGHLCVHPVDARRHLEALLLGSPPAPKPNAVVVIDPGHGGADAGSRSAFDGGWEKDYTLDWARRVRDLLAARGWTALLTREGDTTANLTNRVAFAEQHQADLFLSLHFNSAAPNHAEAGLETYCLTPAGLPSTLTRGYRDDPGLNYPNNEFDRENLHYSLRLQRALLQVNGHADRGVRHARFLTVLQGQHRPAVLIEGGYLSNPAEAKRIADPNYRQKLAQAVVNGLTNPGLTTAGTATPAKIN